MKLPDDLIQKLRESGPPPWRCKLHLARGRTVFGVQVGDDGKIKRIGERVIYSESDLGFALSLVADVTPY